MHRVYRPYLASQVDAKYIPGMSWAQFKTIRTAIVVLVATGQTIVGELTC